LFAGIVDGANEAFIGLEIGVSSKWTVFDNRFTAFAVERSNQVNR
jgi:hypothetical protein